MLKTLLIILTFMLPVTGYAQARQSFKFTRIIFHTSRCFGTCPSYHLQVDNNKKIKLYAQEVFKKGKAFSRSPWELIDSTKAGYFLGAATNDLFGKLTAELQKVGLDKLEFDGATCCDGSLTTIIIYYNGKRKYLQSMFPPEKAGKLISVLYEICEKSELRRTNKNFKIENAKDTR